MLPAQHFPFSYRLKSILLINFGYHLFTDDHWKKTKIVLWQDTLQISSSAGFEQSKLRTSSAVYLEMRKTPFYYQFT